MVKEIPLQNGMVALVDDEDFEKANQYNWTFASSSSNGTTANVARKVDGKAIQLKRFILGIKNPETIVTFKNSDPLDFRKSNLLITNKKDLLKNKRATLNGVSKFKGVSWDKVNSKWVAQIQRDGKVKKIGRYVTELEAAKAYNDYIVNILKEKDTRLNDLTNHVETQVLLNERKGVQFRSPKSVKKYRGVSPNGKRYQVVISKKYIGSFDTSEEAARAYDKKAYELYGDKAILNFPELIEEYKKPLLQ